jgi:hypothetical protein
VRARPALQPGLLILFPRPLTFGGCADVVTPYYQRPYVTLT